MEGVIQTKGLLSLPSNPQARIFFNKFPQQSLKQRLNLSQNPLKPKSPNGFSLTLDGSKKFLLFSVKNHKNPNFSLVCNAAATAGGGAGELEADPPKVLGVDVLTLKKIVPLGLMFFCILFNYTILRDTKDVLVVTAKGSSAEIIPFLKTWVNLPMAIGFMVLYTKLANVLSKKALFYTVILPFIGFFGAFGFVLYPLSGYVHPTALADKLLAVLGPRFLGPLAIMRIWSFCLFYVMAELWGSVVVSVLFWGFANQITTIEEAKKFYPLFGLGANVALIFSGRTVKYFSNMRKHLGPGVDGWAISLKYMMSIVVLMGLAICGLYWWVNTYVPLPTRSKKKEKPNMTTMESLKFLASSPYIRDLATLVVAYGISINLVEVTWKSKLKAQFPSPNEYSSFMGDFSTATGIATFTMMLLSQWIFNKYGWGAAAKITPTVLLLTGVGFFSLILFGDPLAPGLMRFGITPLLAAVYVGAMQNIFSKSAKYSLFDPCKEMAYIPLDEDTKVKGKAAIDVVCNPLGKSGGALIQQFMILTFGSLANSTPYLGGVLLVIVMAWLGAASSLDKQFTALRQEEELEKEMERAAVKIPIVSTNGSLESDSNTTSSTETPYPRNA
ncbi:plastidic ATP/ADP-transporter-like [Bidens hawaiensis]|uniref:plastidic ATP/ADP-transporter-like n=1 Tax=Bidens hawaiensis TaxID=980011 RepID=UPI004048F86F